MAIEFIDVIFRTISSVRKKGESWTGYSILYNRVGGTGGWPVPARGEADECRCWLQCNAVPPAEVGKADSAKTDEERRRTTMKM